ncbi:exodeoxyribonuclease VII large subunit [Anaeropeptidivorans aminofermentans]|uniref:exodeoxyribonuclease VII large subunit n=1 Tax=Anaeropeptidivorans aminofermentans TaxID=2934315 RepID=UPI002024F747|nr:exodeoxyribonuclease VII large subunit [Anaeropeptidivorans aminofermentans]
MEKSFFSVSQINSYIKSILEEDVILSELFIEGEISNFKRHSSGHLYFSLKDENASINCVMFKSSASRINFEMRNGLKVMVFGRISLYEKTGAYQLYAEIIQDYGKGELHIRFEALKNKLYSEGLFDEKYKKPIPPAPKTVALITSPTSAAVRDMIRMGRSINPGIELVIIPSLVQGAEAPYSLVNALDIANRWKKADIIIIGRGGGSIEDLWAFNEEIVARAIFNSKIPVISAVGHETDYTISDFVSDLRAPTPSAAISMSFPDRMSYINTLNYLYKKMDRAIIRKISHIEQEIKALNFKDYYYRLINKNNKDYDRLKGYNRRMSQKMLSNIKNSEEKLSHYASLMEKLSPLRLMSRGYAIAFKNDIPVNSVERLNPGDTIKLMFSDGYAKAFIESCLKNEER